MPLDLEPLELEPVGSKLDLEPLDLEPVSGPRAARRADLQAQQAAARSAGETTSFSARAAAGIEQGLRTPEAMVRGGLDALQYYRALDAVTGSGNRFQRQNEAELRAMRDRDAFLARETQAIEGRDGRNFVGDLVQGVARGVVELPPQLMAGAAGAMRGAAVQASAAMGGVQGGLSQYAQERGEGRSQLEALPPAVASGLITAVTTRAFGDTGIESVFRNEGTQGFRRRLLGVLKDAGMEGAEEFVDQAQQDLLERVTRNPGKPLGESFYDTMQALAVGTVIGGAATAPRLIQRADRPVIVNEQTGTTDFPPLEGDELPPPPPPAPPADPANVPPPIRGEAAMETRPSASWTPDGPRTPAVDPELADAIAAIRAGYNPEVEAPAPAPAAPSTFNLQPSTLPDVPGVPPPLEGQPYDTALRTRPEATMESRPAAPLGLQREPTVSPELADTIQALRQGYQQQLDVPAESRAQSAASSMATPSRFRPRQAVEFSQPLVGPSGASLVAYEWKWTPVEEVDKRGEERIRRISNWEEAQSSAETGRDIVHQFQVKMPDGTVRMVSAESVPVVLGFAKSGNGAKLPTLVNASKTLAQLQMKLALLEQQEASNTEAMAKAKALPLPPITSEPAVATVGKDAGKPYGTRFKMGTDSWVLQREPGPITAERLETLVRSWQDARAKEFGWARPSEHRVDLQNRIARQQKKLDAILQSQPTPPDQSGGPTELTPPAKAEAQPETSNVQRPTSIPDLPTFVAQAIAKEMAPDVNVELVRRRFGAAEAAAAKSSKPTAAEAEMIARAKARAEQQGWAWSEVLRKVQQQLGLDADFLPEGGNDAIQLAAMRKQDALDAARAQRFDASLASLPTTPAPKTPPDQSGGPTAKPSTPAAGQAAPAPPAKAEKIPWRVGVSKDEVFVESDGGRVSRFGWAKVFKSGGQWKAQVFSDQGKALHFVAETDSKAKATKAAKEWAQRQIKTDLLDEATEWIKDVVILKRPPKNSDEAWVSFRKNMMADTRGTAVVDEATFKELWDLFATRIAEVRAAAHPKPTPPDQSGGPTELTPPAKVEAEATIEIGDTALYVDPSRPNKPPVKVAISSIRQLPNDAEMMAEFDYFGPKRVPVSKLKLHDKSQAFKMREMAKRNKAADAATRAQPTPPDQSGGPTELTPPAKAMERGFRNMAARQVEARRVFVENAVDQFGVTPAQAEAALDHYIKRKWAKLDAVNGRYDLKAGNLWEAEAIRQAAAQAKPAAAEERPPGLDPLIQVGKQVMVMRSAKSRKLAKAKVHRITPDGITVYYYKDKTFETVPPLKVQPTNAATGVAAYHAQFKNLSDAERKSAKANARAFKDLIRNEGWRFGWYDPQVEMGATESKSQGILADEAFDRGLQKALAALRVEPDPDTPDVQLAKLLPRLREYIEQNTPLGERQNLAWMQATAQPDANDVPVYGNALSIGQTLEVDGEPVKVTAIDPDTGMVTLEDGTKFGTQQLEDDALIYVDKVNAPPAREAVRDDWDQPSAPDFALNEPESVEEQKARLAQEQAQRDAQAQRDKLAELQAKPLTGTTGDLGQGSLLDAPQDLFAPPSAIDSAIAALEAAKVKPGGLYALPDLGLTVTLWNGTLTAAQVALRAGRTLAQAVQAGVDWLRAQGQAFDEAEVRKALELGLLQAPGIREHVGKRLLQEDFSPAAKAALEPLLRYEVKPDAQLFAEAAAVVEAIGPMEAEANYFGNPWGLPADAHVVLGFAIGNGLSTLEAQARAAGDTALADRIGRQNAEFQSQFVLQSTETARTLRAYRYFDLVGNLSPFTADLFARKVIERASQKQKQRIKPALDKGPDGEPGLTDRLNDINRTGIEEAARTPEVQGAARTAINQAIEEEAERKDTAVERAITLEVSNTLETLPSVVRKANAAVLGAWDKLSAGEQVRQQTGRAGQGLENSLWSAVKQRGGTASTVSSVIAQVNRALHEQMNRALGITPQQFVNPTTYLMRLRDALGNAEVMSRIWEQTRAAVGANLAAIGEMERLLVRIEAEIAELEAEAKTPLAGGPEVTAKDAKLKAQQQAARDEMLKGRNANLADAIKQRRDRIADVTAQLAEYRKMQPAWQAVMGMTVDVWGPNLLRGLLREQMKADGFRLRKAVADHFRGLAGAPDPLQSLGVLRDKLIAASGLDPQAAERLAKDLEAEYTAQVNKERARLAERLAKARELAKAKAAEREAKRPQLDAESMIDAYERRQTEWLKPTGRKSAVRAIVRQALREGAAVAGLNEQVVRGGVQAQLEAVGVPREAAYRLAYEVWQDRQAKGGGIDAVVAARVKQLQLDLGRVIRQHWTQVDKAGESLAEHIVGETKMPAEQAERLATAIQRRFKALVQARKEQALRNLAKTPAARELQKPSVAQRIIEATNLGALDSEGLWQAVADKLGLPTYSDEASAEVKRLADRAQQLPEGSVQRQEATARLMRFIARQKGVNLGDLGWAFWYANTLSGPFTHAVNAFSNVLSLAGNVSTQFRDVRGIPQILAATAKGFRTGLTEARAIVKQGPGANRTKFTEQGQALENLDPQDFTGAGLVSQWRYVARALAASDAAFYFPAREAKAITLARALARQEGKTGAAIRTRAQQILDGTEEQQNLWGAQVDRERAQLVAMGEKPDALWTTRRLEQLREQGWGPDIGEAADDFALRTTYNNRPYGLIGTLADVAKFAQNRVPGARGVVPFVNVVANVVNDSINYTPWGFARAYAAGRTGEPSVTLSLPFEWAEKLREGKSPMTPDAVVDLHAKAALGTAMFGSLMAMALANLDDDDGENYQLYGSGPKDAAAKAALRETGWLPYSVRVNGTYVSFANTPLAIPLGALGHYLDAARYDKRFEQADAFNRLGVALWGGAHIITQQSFIDGLARLLGALEERRGRIDTASDRAVEQAFRSISSVAVPNALRQLDRLNDPKIYDARGIEGALVAAIPFARRAGSPALNAFGEPITNEPWKRFASDAEANVWTDLARRKIYPSVADKAKNSNGREMTDDEHYRYVQESGQAIKRRLETPGMRQMIRSGKEEDARKAVTAIVREERERARRRLGF